MPDLEAIRKRAEAATPGPWGWNSYSRIDAHHLVANYDDPNAPDYPDEPRPGRLPGHAFGDAEDRAWIAQRRAAYEADPVVAHVPAEYGDTATGRHAADAEFIANARTDIPDLLLEIVRLHAELAHWKIYPLPIPGEVVKNCAREYGHPGAHLAVGGEGWVSREPASS